MSYKGSSQCHPRSGLWVDVSHDLHSSNFDDMLLFGGGESNLTLKANVLRTESDKQA